MEKEDLHIVGLVSIYISSKFEDVFPIQIDEILNLAAHGKYSLV